MDWTLLNLNTFIPEMPQIIDNNFASFKRYLDIIYNETSGVVVVPINTTGRVKAATGEFVNVVVDNLTVKKQYTNLYNNVTTVNLDYYNAYNGPDASVRDASISQWEDPAFKYIDVIAPYYKIKNDASVAFKSINAGQIVNILFDISYGSPFNIKLSNSEILTIPATDAASTYQLELICINVDSSLLNTWKIIEYDKLSSGSSGVSQTYVDGSLNKKIGTSQSLDTSTSNQIRFDKTMGYIYGTINSPLTGALTMTSTGALIGVSNLIIHKDNSTGVSLPATWKKLSGTYDGSVNNYIYVQYIDASNQLYTINKTI